MKISAHRFSMPTQCALWKKPKGVEGKRTDTFEIIDTYVDDEHLIRRLLKCRECGHLYFYEMNEEIDWVDGDDPQYRTYIPIANKGKVEMLKNASPLELLQAL